MNTSEAETQLAPLTRRFVEENMLDFALKSPRLVVQDPTSRSTTPQLVAEILGDGERFFVENSKKIASNLYEAQTGGSPSGILIVALATTPEGNGLAILKAEHQEGMQLKQITEGGTRHFDLEHLNELIIGNNSRVYKIAMLHLSDGQISGQMVDQQNGVAFAAFFLGAFLGCRLAENAEIQTKEFVDSALSFANRPSLDPAKQARYATAIVAYIHSPSETFEASEFAGLFLDVEDRDAFLGSVPGSIASAVIRKDTTLIPGRGSGLRLYGNGVVVSASADALERGALVILSEEERETVIQVNGSIRRFSLGNAPRA